MNRSLQQPDAPAKKTEDLAGASGSSTPDPWPLMNRSLQLKLAAAGALLVMVLVGVYLFLGANIDPDTPNTGKRNEGVEQPLERARSILRKDADLSACRLALQ